MILHHVCLFFIEKLLAVHKQFYEIIDDKELLQPEVR